jgi:hypothetical protein
LGGFEIKEKFKLVRAHLLVGLRLLTHARRPSDSTTLPSQPRPPPPAPVASGCRPTWAWPYLLVHDLVEDSLLHFASSITTTMLRSPAFMLPPCAPSPATVTTSHHRPSRPRGPLLSPLRLAPVSSPSHRQTPLPKPLHRRVLPP